MVVETAKRTIINDLMVNDNNWLVPCWLCGEPVRVRFSKKNKPFLLCKGCGCQVFVRYGKGEDLLMDKVQQYRNRQMGGK